MENWEKLVFVLQFNNNFELSQFRQINAISCAASFEKFPVKLAQFLCQFLVQGNLHNYLDILHWLWKIGVGEEHLSRKKLIGFKLAAPSTLRQKQSSPQCFRLK